MKLKNIIIEAEEQLARKLEQYDLTYEEFIEFQTEYDAYLAENYHVPDDTELDRMCQLSRNRW